MQLPNDSTYGKPRVAPVFGVGWVLCSLLMLLLGTTALLAQPANPTNLFATASSSSQIALAWDDNSADEDSFKIERSLNSGGPFTKIAAVGADVENYSDNTVLDGTQYYYRVYAKNGSGDSGYSNTADDITPLAAPTSLTATTISNSQINLAWTDNSSSETGYKIERKTGVAGTYTEIASGVTGTTYSSTGLASNTEYYYQVRAHNTAAGNSAYSNEANATTFPDAPTAPSTLSATAVGSGEIDLTWTDNSTNEDGFKIERKTGAGGTYAPIDTVVGVTNYSDTGLTEGTEYYYKVLAFNTGGNSAYTNEANATTQPGIPTSLTATPFSNTRIDLAWTDNSNSESSFKIERKTGVAGTYTQIATVSTNVTTYQSTGLNPNTTYYYRVRAFSTAGGNSAYSNEAFATTLPSPPAAPSSLTATAMSEQQIDLTWSDNSSTEDGFKIERKLTSGVTYTQIATVGSDVTSYSNTGLLSNTSYTYRVRAYNTGGNSAYSNTSSATTLVDPPTAPDSLAAVPAGVGGIDLTWGDDSNNEDGFKIERKLTAAPLSAFSQIAQVGANVENYSDSGLLESTAYTYRVRAFRGTPNSHSAYADTASATTNAGPPPPPTPPAAPSNLIATAISNEQIDLIWNNVSSETGFTIEIGTSAGGPFTMLDTNTADDTTYSVSGLDAETQYFFRVYASNAGGNSGYSNVANATTQPELPQAPSGLTAMAASFTQINLAWTDNAGNESGFKIERKLNTIGASYSEIATVGANVTTYSDAGLTVNTAYVYRVRANNAAGNSAYSNEAGATTNVPVAPSGLTATTISNIQIDLAWADNAGDEAGYLVEIKINDGSFMHLDSLAADATTYSSIGLVPSTPYTFRVRAYNLVGNSAYSNEASATTLADPAAAPSNLTATPMSNTQIDLSWTDNSNNETGFLIQGKLTSAATFNDLGTVGPNVTSYSHTGLTANTSYTYRVRAFNGAGNSVFSNQVSATTLPDPPAAPSNLTGTPVSFSQINLEWDDNSSDESGFKLERKLTAAPPTAFAEIATPGANDTTYANSGLTANTAYTYRIRAFNAGGANNSAYSDTLSVATLPGPPAAPDSLIATTVSSGQIDLVWDDNTDETSYKIEMATSSGGPYTEIATNAQDDTTLSVTGLDPNTAYYFRVRAQNTNGISGYSNVANATTNPVLPVAPSDLTATAVGSNKIDLTWSDNSNSEDGFKIERKLTSAVTFNQVATVGPNVTSYSSTGLTPSTSYTFRIRAYNTTGNSAYSNTASATSLVSPPAAPSALAATAVSGSQIDLSWTDNASNEDGFKVERKAASDTAYSEIASLSANAVSYSSTGLTANTQYSYRVRAFRGTPNSFSSYSNVATATTPASTPNPPSSLVATAISKSQIDLTWTDNAGNENGFRIERKVDVGGTYAQIDSVGPDVTSYSNMALFGNTPYYYRVRAYNANGNSPYSNEANALTLMNGPSNLTATAVSSSQINLTWTDNSGSETGYRIERKTGAGGTYAQIDTAAANATSYSSTGLAASTQYFYRVRAYSATNVSAFSNEASATTSTPGSTPNPPSGLTATAVSKSQINLAWTDNSSNETGFLIERKTGSGGTYAEIATVGAGVANFNNTGLSVNTQYFYRVRATNGSGNSAYSNEANARTFMNGPSNLTATAISTSQINLSWTDNTTNETGFQVERSTASGGPFTQVGTPAQNATSFSDNGLAENTQYFYRVRAINASNVSGYTDEASATTLSSGGLPAPSNLAATAVSMSQINLTWADNSSTETGFKIERKQGATGSYSQIATVGANVTTFANTGLSLNTTYFYRVRAFDATSNSAFSAEASATTFIKAPSNLVATKISTSQINLTWTDNSNTETGFKIERKTGSGGTYAEIAAVGANVTSFSNTGLTVNTTYFYRVRGVSSTTVSAYSNEASATTSVTKENASSLDAAQPTDIVLAPNYPNPFNPSTTIKFTLPEGVNVSLKVVNVTGQEVATLVEGFRAAGAHQVTFKATKLPSGIYYAVLKAGEVTQIQRMTLAK